MTEKAYSRCGEEFNTKLSDIEVGETYYSGDVVNILSPSDLVSESEVDYLLDNMDGVIFDFVGVLPFSGECSGLHLSKEDKLRLTKMIKDFMDDHTEVNYFKVDNIQKHVMED